MGTVLPRRFEPIRVLRKGNACSTFVATDQYLGINEVVVKVIRKGDFASGNDVAEDLSWYRGLRHPFLSEVLDAGLTPKRDLFYVRQYHPESEFFSSGNREPVKALVSALDLLRSTGRIHGAIKPSNIFASSGGLKIADPWTRRGQANQKQLVEQDIRFSAPEVLGGEAPSLESDLYSLGAVLYRFFAGRDPFEASDPDFLKAKYIWATPRSLGSVSHVSRRIAEIVTNLLDKDPTRRGPAFETLKNELEVEPLPASRAPAIGLDSKVGTVIRHLTSTRGLAVAVVEGPAGSGKSRLVEELRSRVLFGDVPMAVCETTALEPSLSLSRRLIALAEECGIAVGLPSLSRLRRFVEEGQEPLSKLEEERFGQDLADSIAAVSRHVRLLVIIEDIDRTGRRLAPLLQRMAREMRDVELSVVATARPSGVSNRTANQLRDCLSERFLEVSVEPLAPAEIEHVGSFLLLEPDHRARAQQRSAGNPGFLEQFCKNPSAAAIPKQVRQVFSALITSLPSHTKWIAEVLSLFEEPASWEVLFGVSEVPERELKQAIRELERLGLVSNRGFSIRYPDARTLLHSRISKAKRTELHARAYQFLQQAGCSENILAYHAFEGALFAIASELYRRLANQCLAERNYTRSGRYFGLVLECLSRDSTVDALDADSIVKLARCHGMQGNKIRAQAILKNLLESRAASEDAELQASIYSTLASPTIEDSPPERVRLLRLAIDSLRPDSPSLIYQYVALASALLSLGNLDEVQGILERTETLGFPEESLRQLEPLRGSLLLHLGNFKDAIRCFSGKPPVWSSPARFATNLAVCFEELGDLNRARELQLSALRDAESSGALLLQIVSLSNVGAMETKLGNIRAAEAVFDLVNSKLRSLRRQRGGVEIKYLVGPFTSMAVLEIQKGDYQNAAAHLASINLENPGPFFQRELFFVAMTRCELYLELEQLELATAILNDAKALPVRGDLFAVERTLVEERLERASIKMYSQLEKALETCERLGTIYLGCRVHLALAKHLIEMGEQDRAKVFAEKARRISNKNRYKPLAARALLLCALSMDREGEKIAALKDTMHEAADLGFAPLVAEAAFRLGAALISRGDYTGSREYLARAFSITSRLADELNSRDRKTYLSKPIYREGRVNLNHVSTTVALPPKATDLLDHEGSFFARLYRLSAAVMAATDLNGAVAMLLQALKEAMNYSMVVVMAAILKPEYFPIRLAVSEEVRKRVTGAASSAGDKPYIGGYGAEGTQYTVIWIPMPSVSSSGGFYVESVSGDAVPNEREIEFLTLAAAIFGAAYGHLCMRPRIPNTSTAIDLYGIVGGSKQIEAVRARIEIAATNAASVLIEGESGTGKELVARAIHGQSGRAKGPFIAVDCGALPEGLIEAELFGAKRGSYTGATSDRQGLFEAANRGTIFLDEIANLGITAQAKLLRVLQEREIRMLGSMIGKAIDVRLIAATNCNLEKLVREGKFRQDLLYRLKVLHVLLPPLRSRKDDVPVLATTFLERLNSANQSKKYFGSRVMEKFAGHNFPGNIRELQNVVERAFYTSTSAVISDIEFFDESSSIDSPAVDETASWFKNLTEGRQKFWPDVRDRYKRRDISRERVVALVDFGLRITRGHYKKMASMFQIPREQYHRFMDFLRRNQCLLDFRPYRKSGEASD